MAKVNVTRQALRETKGFAVPNLDDLFAVGTTDPNSEAAKDALLIRWDAIESNPSQPRQSFDSEALQELAHSITQDGQLQPILVRPHPKEADKYQVVMGERRWRACGPQYANLPFVRAVVRSNVNDSDAFRLALIENVMREDLNDVDKARGLVALKKSMQESNTRVTWEEVGATLGYSRVHISRLVSMLRLPEDVQEQVRRGTVSSRQARAIAREPDPERRIKLVERAKSGVSSDELQKETSSSITIHHSVVTSAEDTPTRNEQLLNIRRAVAWAGQIQEIENWQDWPKAEREALLEAVAKAALVFPQAHAHLLQLGMKVL